MRYVVDTHTLLWYFMNERRLGKQAHAILKDPAQRLIFPALVLAEGQHITHRKNLPIAFDTILQKIVTAPRCVIVPIDIFILAHIFAALDIHDSLIVATALHCRVFFNEDISILTNDRAIIGSGLIPVVW